LLGSLVNARGNVAVILTAAVLQAEGRILRAPEMLVGELAQKLGIRTAAKSNFYDLIIVGSGPAGSDLNVPAVER